MHRPLLLILFCLVIIAVPKNAFTGPALKIWSDFRYMPLSEMTEPNLYSENNGSQPLAGPEIRMQTVEGGVAFPMILHDGQTKAIHSFSYKDLRFAHRNLFSNVAIIDRLYSLQYRAFIMRELSERCHLIAVANPGVGSGRNESLQWDAVTLKTALGFIRKVHRTLQIGSGFAYVHNFIEPMLVPIFYCQWRLGPTMYIKGLLPASIDFGYQLNRQIGIGAAFRIYQDYYYADPQLRHNLITFAPKIAVRPTQCILLSLAAGVAVEHSIKTRDESTNWQSYDVEAAPYLQFRVTLNE